MIDEKWEELLFKFRSLGGVADNVCQKEGKYGRGIFRIESNLQSKIFTPFHLMIKHDDMIIVNNKVRIKEDSIYNPNVREFFDFYQDFFSWGGGGKESSETVENELNLFPTDLKKILSTYGIVDIDHRHKCERNAMLLRQFLQARVFSVKANAYLVPILELVNHDSKALPFISINNGLGTPIQRQRDLELFFCYGYKSSLTRLFNYGFFIEESVVFSFPFNFYIPEYNLNLKCEGKELLDDNILMQRDENEISIIGLPIADKYMNKLSNSYLDEISTRTNLINLKSIILSKIIEFNLKKRLDILKIIGSSDANSMSKMLQKAIEYECNLISLHRT